MMDKSVIFEMEKLIEDLDGYQHMYTKKKTARLKELFHPIADNERKKEFRQQRNLKWSWSKFDPRQKIQQATDCLSGIINHYEEAKAEIDTYQKETQDILHAIELTELTDEELTDYMKRLREIRKYRRIAKNFVEVAEPLYHVALANKNVVKELGKASGEIQRIVTTIESRTYRPRVITSLEEAFTKAKSEVVADIDEK